jgi:hypothetical protein
MGAALATVTVQHERAARPKQVRISARVKTAVEAMVDEGLNRAEAALKAGITDNALYIALRKPEVLAYRNERMKVIRTSAGSQTIFNIAGLASSAQSEAVKLDANKWLAGTDPHDPITPLQKSESTINHKGIGPGLTIVFGAPQQGPLIDGQASEVEFVSREKHLSLPVPHPNGGTPAVRAEISGEIEAPGKRGRG